MRRTSSSALVLCAGLGTGAQAGLTVTPDLADGEVTALTDGLIVWEAEGRFGDRGGAAERELGVGASTAQNQADEAQVDWANALAAPDSFTGYAYTVTWDGVNTLMLDVTGIDAGGNAVIENLVYNLPADVTNVTDLYLRAAGNASVNASLEYEIDGVNGMLSGGIGDVSVDNVRISGTQLSDGFTLSGVFNFAWTDLDATRNARPSWQIKAATPSPGAAALLGAASVIATRRRR